MKTKPICPCRKRRGTSLLETLFATGIVSMVFLAGITLYVSTARSTVKTQGQVFSGYDAANASQAVLELAREAYRVSLPISPTPTGAIPFAPPRGSISDYSTTATIDGTSQTVYTGIRLLFRRPSSVQVGSAGGTRTVPLYDYSNNSNPLVDSVWIYRGNSDGAPNAATGRFLCVSGSLTGRPALKPTLLSTIDSTSRTGVVFERRAGEPQLLRFQIRSMYYSPIGQNNAVTSDNRPGGTSELSARCVILRSFEE